MENERQLRHCDGVDYILTNVTGLDITCMHVSRIIITVAASAREMRHL